MAGLKPQKEIRAAIGKDTLTALKWSGDGKKLVSKALRFSPWYKI
ncbi:MAG: hypothetical protein ACOVS5_05605 [Oligoflexus sp.]|jgi:hypothetical protein